MCSPGMTIEAKGTQRGGFEDVGALPKFSLGLEGETVDFRDRLDQGRVVSMGMRAWGRDRRPGET